MFDRTSRDRGTSRRVDAAHRSRGNGDDASTWSRGRIRVASFLQSARRAQSFRRMHWLPSRSQTRRHGSIARCLGIAPAVSLLRAADDSGSSSAAKTIVIDLPARSAIARCRANRSGPLAKEVAQAPRRATISSKASRGPARSPRPTTALPFFGPHARAWAARALRDGLRRQRNRLQRHRRGLDPPRASSVRRIRSMRSSLSIDY